MMELWQEGNFEVNASWDWKPVEVFQKGEGELVRDLEHVTTRASVLWIMDSICMRDRFVRLRCQTDILVIYSYSPRGNSAGDEIVGAFGENWSDVAKGTNMIET